MLRRDLLRIAASAGLCSLVPIAARGQLLATRPRHRVIVDNDFSGDPDGLFQLAHHLASPATEVTLVIGSHIHLGDFLDKSGIQSDNAVSYVYQLMKRMRLERRPEVVAG